MKDDRRRSVEPGMCGGEFVPLDMAVAEGSVVVFGQGGGGGLIWKREDNEEQVVRGGMGWNGDVNPGVEVEICRCARTLRVPLSHHGRPIRQWGGLAGCGMA